MKGTAATSPFAATTLLPQGGDDAGSTGNLHRSVGEDSYRRKRQPIGSILVDMKLELVPVPVSDVDRAKAFYAEKVGFTVDLDHQVTDKVRIVQLTPPGSACSILLGSGVVRTPPGSIENLHLVVSDIHAARSQLIERGVEVSEVETFGGGEGQKVDDPEQAEFLSDKPPVSYAYFKDPDGNSWALQQLPY
jgi:catechol 2,3-dioxygenase-like lactoylglutathione lyase family enzyme